MIVEMMIEKQESWRNLTCAILNLSGTAKRCDHTATLTVTESYVLCSTARRPNKGTSQSK